MEEHHKYLRAPTVIRGSKKKIFQALKNRVWGKLQGWKEKVLSRTGNEILIKAVMRTILTYLVEFFTLLDTLVDELHGHLQGQVWTRKIHWQVSLDLCRPYCFGGLGFR